MSHSSKKVFLSYAHEDSEYAKRLYSDLKNNGVGVWFDQEDLLPGANWPYEIRNIIKKASYFLAVLSKNSITKRGYVQKELKLAIDVLQEFPDSEIFLIPVRLDDCRPVSDELRHLHWVDLFADWDKGIFHLLRVLKKQATKPSPTKQRTTSEKESKNIDLSKIVLECPHCGGNGTAMSHSGNNETTQWFMCWDCHIPFPELWERLTDNF